MAGHVLEAAFKKAPLQLLVSPFYLSEALQWLFTVHGILSP